MDQQTLTTIVAAVGVLVTLLGYLRGMKHELKEEIAAVNSRVDESRTELRGDIGELDGRLTTIEQRTYDLSTRLPPAAAGQTG